MSVIVKGIFGKEMQMPQEGYVDIRLHFKGGRIECATMQTGNPPYYATFKVVELPPHGRLGDLDAIYEEISNGNKAYNGIEGYDGKYPNIANVDDCLEVIKYADTVIEAEGET